MFIVSIKIILFIENKGRVTVFVAAAALLVYYSTTESSSFVALQTDYGVSSCVFNLLRYYNAR